MKTWIKVATLALLPLSVMAQTPAPAPDPPPMAQSVDVPKLVAMVDGAKAAAASSGATVKHPVNRHPTQPHRHGKGPK